jgi:hypothetical protein
MNIEKLVVGRGPIETKRKRFLLAAYNDNDYAGYLLIYLVVPVFQSESIPTRWR